MPPFKKAVKSRRETAPKIQAIGLKHFRSHTFFFSGTITTKNKKIRIAVLTVKAGYNILNEKR
jgi:hypothetical protein